MVSNVSLAENAFDVCVFCKSLLKHWCNKNFHDYVYIEVYYILIVNNANTLQWADIYHVYCPCHKYNILLIQCSGIFACILVLLVTCTLATQYAKNTILSDDRDVGDSPEMCVRGHTCHVYVCVCGRGRYAHLMFTCGGLT